VLLFPAPLCANLGTMLTSLKTTLGYGYYLAIIASLCLSSVSRAQSITILQQDKPANIRGLSVVDNNTAWVSGSRGTIAITNDGGKTWAWQQVKGYEKSDFRDIEAFNDKEAVIMSSGTPALVLKTTDGGKTWQEKLRKTDSVYFFDAMDFADAKHGYILGDPIGNKFLLMETTDGGETWTQFANQPDALPGEASFAASGTCLRVEKGTIWIASGGKRSRMLSLTPGGDKWAYIDLPITQGKSSEGAFSMAIIKNTVVIAGGDYSKDKKTDSVAVVYTGKPKPEFTAPAKGPAGFQSCVECLSDGIFLTTGTPGSHITVDNGKTWQQIDATSFNVCRKAKKGKLVLLAGDKGKIGIFKF